MIWYPPILSYHRVVSGLGSDTPTVSPATFEKQMATLRRFWNPISLADLLLWLEWQQALPPRPVVVTFDDGSEDTYTYAFPILRKYRIPATVFMIAANVNQPNSLTSSQIQDMAQDGVTVGSHTVNHAYLPSLSLEESRKELFDSKRILEQWAPRVDFLSYPAGGFTPEIQGIARAAGYRLACTTNRGLRRFPTDRWALRRITMHATRSLCGMWWKANGYYEINHRLRPPA
jgi:peptidoglycan/xylan/chitin deacetylase (PgdA/CDA1 family)